MSTRRICWALGYTKYTYSTKIFKINNKIIGKKLHLNRIEEEFRKHWGEQCHVVSVLQRKSFDIKIKQLNRDD